MTQSVSYGVPTDRCGLQLRLGIEKGFFREHGIDLSLRVVFGGPEIAAEFDSGRLKVGELGYAAGTDRTRQGRPIQDCRQRRATGSGAIFRRPSASVLLVGAQRLEVGRAEPGELQRLVHARSASALWS